MFEQGTIEIPNAVHSRFRIGLVAAKREAWRPSWPELHRKDVKLFHSGPAAENSGVTGERRYVTAGYRSGFGRARHSGSASWQMGGNT
jgi:hypothetical protein